MQLHTVYFICKLLYMFRVVSPPIIRSINNCIYSIWYWSTVVATCRYRGRVETQSLLMMGGETTRNMYSSLQIKYAVKSCILLDIY